MLSDLIFSTLLLFQTTCVPPVLQADQMIVFTKCQGINPLVMQCMTDKEHQATLKLMPVIEMFGYDEHPTQKGTPIWVRDLKSPCKWNHMKTDGTPVDEQT